MTKRNAKQKRTADYRHVCHSPLLL